MTPPMLARMPLASEYGAWSGPLRPSSEWRLHVDIMHARPDVGAIVHTHARHATALSMLQRPIRAAHYMIALFGGATVECTRYADFGTQELSKLAVAGLSDRHAVLLGNHGMVVTGADLPAAMRRAYELETLAEMYGLALAAGRPVILTNEEVTRAIERFKSYGVAPQLAQIGRGQRPAKAKTKVKATVKTRPKAKSKPAPGRKKTRSGR
jgi:L-fuculose-phosphate aldolase